MRKNQRQVIKFSAQPRSGDQASQLSLFPALPFRTPEFGGNGVGGTREPATKVTGTKDPGTQDPGTRVSGRCEGTPLRYI